MRPRRRAERKKKSEGLWAMIYIDLMTQIMAFFVVIWAIDLGDKATATPQLATGMGMGIGDQSVRMVDLPGDVLFGSGKTELGAEGRGIIGKLFGDRESGVLSFDQGGLATRKLVIHGHTDDLGPKDENFELGYQRAWSVYREIRAHSTELPQHVVLCTHADNTPSRAIDNEPADGLQLTAEERDVIRQARAKNRRITIEDLVVAAPKEETAAAPSAPPTPPPPASPGGAGGVVPSGGRGAP